MDPTLTVADEAADAKATGDRIAAVADKGLAMQWTPDNVVSGRWNAREIVADSKRICIAELYDVQEGDILRIGANPDGLYFGYGIYEGDSTSTSGYSDWITRENVDITLEYTGKLMINFATAATSGSSSAISPEDLTIEIGIVSSAFARVEHRIDELETHVDEKFSEIFSSPDGYARISYLQSDGAVRINTNLTMNQNSRVVCRFAAVEQMEINADTGYLFGARYSTTSKIFSFGQYAPHSGSSGNPDERWISGYNGGSKTFAPTPDPDIDIKYIPFDLKWHTVDFNGRDVYFDGDLVREYPEATFTTNNALRLFSLVNHASSAYTYYDGKFKLAECWIYQDGTTLSRHYIPVRRESDDELGLYDLVHGTFNAKVGDGSFISGGDITLANEDVKITELESGIADLSAEIGAVEDKVDDLAGQLNQKDYVIAEADRVADLVRRVQTGRTITMVAVTDMHSKDGNKTIKNALLDMGSAVKLIAQQVHVDYMMLFGDIIYRLADKESVAEGRREMIQSTKIIGDAFGLAPQIRMVGNHDPNGEKSGDTPFSPDELNAYYGIYNTMLTKDEAHPAGGYGYMDLDRQKIRVIVLNTSYYDNVTVNAATGKTQYSFGDVQAGWLAGALDLTAKSDASEWKIIITAHIRIDTVAQTAISKYANLINAYQDGSSVTINGHTYNFTGKNAAPIVLYLNGHSHCIYVRNIGYVTSSGATITSNTKLADMGIPNALPDRENASMDGVTYTKTAGSAESTAFFVITLDTDNGVLYAHHYGSGFDIIYHYESASATTGTELTTSLTDAEWNSNDSEIATVSDGTVTALATGNVTVYAREPLEGSETKTKTIEAWNLAVTAAEV